MGTMIQAEDLSVEDYGGEEYDGCVDYLNITRPDVIERIHAAYFEVGVDIVETNTFSATRLVLGEYGLEDKVREINVEAARIARRAADRYSSAARPRFVAGSMGSGTRLPSVGQISYDELRELYHEQAAALIEGGVDILLIETCQDLLQAKAAIRGALDAKTEAGVDIPLQVQVTVEATGAMLVGSDIATALTALEPLEVDLIGMNCATGPELMREHVQYLSRHSRLPISILPNAGLPENVGGEAVYPLTPDQLAAAQIEFIDEFGVAVVGGCCGTTPAHIEALVKAVRGKEPRVREPETEAAASSLYTVVALQQEPPPLLVGERSNANG